MHMQVEQKGITKSMEGETVHSETPDSWREPRCEQAAGEPRQSSLNKK